MQQLNGHLRQGVGVAVIHDCAQVRSCELRQKWQGLQSTSLKLSGK
jgi:hypothetical protein